MNKFLNFSTILCSYVLITVLVISCGSGGDDANSNNAVNNDTDQSADTNDGAGDDAHGATTELPVEPKDTNCLLPDRADKDSLAAVLCSEGVVIGKITKQKTIQNKKFLIPSTENTAGTTTSRTWDISKKDAQIQISYNKDYTLTVAGGGTGGPIGTLSNAEGHTAEYPLKILTIPSMLNDVENDSGTNLRSGSLEFQSSSSSLRISASLRVSLAVKSQDDFISMGRFTLPPLGESSDSPLPYVLANDLDLVAPGGVADKFNNAIIPVADAAFAFDGGGHTINLKSAIDTTAIDKPAAIIGKVTKRLEFYNVTFNINAPISGRGNVGTIVGYGEAGATSKMHYSKVNINKNITVYKSVDNENGYVGGLVGSGPVFIYNVVVKTGDGAVIQAFAQNNATQNFAPAIGGLIGKTNNSAYMRDSIVDVTLGAETSDDGFAGNFISLGGLAGVIFRNGYSDGNLIKLVISRGKLPADFSFDTVAGLVADLHNHSWLGVNLVYADFSNLGKVHFLGGLVGKIPNGGSDIFNNMIFIADGFTGSDVQTSFGAAIALYGSTSYTVLEIEHNFVSSPFTDNDYTTNAKLASFVHTANQDINFNKLIILDNKDADVMFKAGDEATNLKGKVVTANVSDLEGAKTAAVHNTFTGFWFWEVGSQHYLQLRTDYDTAFYIDRLWVAEMKREWAETNIGIQLKLAARAARASQ